MGPQGSLDLEWEQVQTPGVEIQRMWTRFGEKSGQKYAALSILCACDCAKEYMLWAGTFMPVLVEEREKDTTG